MDLAFLEITVGTLVELCRRGSAFELHILYKRVGSSSRLQILKMKFGSSFKLHRGGNSFKLCIFENHSKDFQ